MAILSYIYVGKVHHDYIMFILGFCHIVFLSFSSTVYECCVFFSVHGIVKRRVKGEEKVRVLGYDCIYSLFFILFYAVHEFIFWLKVFLSGIAYLIL